MSDNDRTRMSNYYTKELLKMTFAPCTGCVTSWSENSDHTFGTTGCCFPVIEDDDARDVFGGMIKNVTASEDASTVQTIQCGRCWAHGRECFSPPEDLLDYDKIYQVLRQMETGKKPAVATDKFPLPAGPPENPLDDDDAAAQAVQAAVLPALVDLTAHERKALRYDLAHLCRHVGKRIQKFHSPSWDKMQFHTGALNSIEASESGARPDEKSKSNKKRDAFSEGITAASNKRALEVKEESEKGISPKRSRPSQKPTAAAVRGTIATLNSEINGLEQQHAKVGKRVKNSRGIKLGLTSEINKKKDRIAELQASIV